MPFILAIFVSFLFLPINSFAQTASSPKVVIVTATPVMEGVTSPTINITGSVYFSLTSAVAAESSGKVAKVYINEGDIVKAGQPLAALDDVLLSYGITTAEAETAQAQSNLEKTKRDYERNSSLFSQQAVAQKAYDDSFTDYKNAQNSYSASAANEKKLKTEKGKMIVRSPFNGVVTSKDINVGEWVNAGGVVANVAALDFEAKIYLPEKVLKFINVGDKVNISTDSGDIEGVVLSVNYKGDPATRTFLTRIRLGDRPELKEGVLATASVPSSSVIKSLLVPRDAVVLRGGEKGVFLISGGKVAFVSVKIIANSGGNLAVSGALKAGDMVVMNGNDKVNAGSTVKIVSGLAK